MQQTNMQQTFGTKMRTLRIFRGMSQVDLQKLTGIDTRYISEMENDKILPNPNWEDRIREALRWPSNAEEAFSILQGESK